MLLLLVPVVDLVEVENNSTGSRWCRWWTTRNTYSTSSITNNCNWWWSETNQVEEDWIKCTEVLLVMVETAYGGGGGGGAGAVGGNGGGLLTQHPASVGGAGGAGLQCTDAYWRTSRNHSRSQLVQ